MCCCISPRSSKITNILCKSGHCPSISKYTIYLEKQAEEENITCSFLAALRTSDSGCRKIPRFQKQADKLLRKENKHLSVSAQDQETDETSHCLTRKCFGEMSPRPIFTTTCRVTKPTQLFALCWHDSPTLQNVKFTPSNFLYCTEITNQTLNYLPHKWWAHLHSLSWRKHLDEVAGGSIYTALRYPQGRKTESKISLSIWSLLYSWNCITSN